MRTGAMLAAAVMASVGFLLVMAGSGEAAGAPQAVLDIYQERASADAEGEGSDEIMLNGTVKVLVPWSPEQQVVEVTLEVLDENLNWVFDPPKLVFEKTGDKVQHFDLRLSVPCTYPAGENNVEIGGRWRYKPGITGGIIESDTIIMTMAPYEDGDISAPSSVDLVQDQNRTVPLVIENPGNVGEHYQIEAEGREMLSNVGIGISIEEDGLIEVTAGQEGELEVLLSGKDISPERTHHLTLKLLDMDSGMEYDRVIVSIHTVAKEETPSPAPIGDDDDDDEEEDPNDKNDGSEPPEVNTSGGGISGVLIGYILVVLVLGAAATSGFVIYRKRKD